MLFCMEQLPILSWDRLIIWRPLYLRIQMSSISSSMYRLINGKAGDLSTIMLLTRNKAKGRKRAFSQWLCLRRTTARLSSSSTDSSKSKSLSCFLDLQARAKVSYFVTMSTRKTFQLSVDAMTCLDPRLPWRVKNCRPSWKSEWSR